MAITLPVYTRCARQNVGDPGGTGEFPGTPIKIRVHGDAAAEGDSLGIPRGLLVGVTATTGASAGDMTVRVYSDSSKTDELLVTVLTMSASPFKASDTLAQPIPFYEAPFFTIQCSVDPNETVFVTFYVKSMAGGL